MRVVLAIAKRFVLGLLKDKANLLYMVLMPIVFTGLFGVLPGASQDSTVPISVVDDDRTAISKAFIQYLSQDGAVQVSQIPEDRAARALRNWESALVITIPAGFQESLLNNHPTDLKITPSPNQGGSTVAFEHSLLDTVQTWEVAGVTEVLQSGGRNTNQATSTFIVGAGHAKQIHSLVTTSRSVRRDGTTLAPLKPGQQAIIGFATMFIMFSVFGATGSILEEKRSGTWSRIKASPAPKYRLLAGYCLGFFCVGWIQFIMMYTIGRLLFRIDLPMNGWVVLTISLYVLATCGIALCVSGLVNTSEQHMGIGTFVAIATSMLGGAYWPIDYEPVWMQHVAWLVPQDWTMEALQVIAVGAPSTSLLMWPLIVLAGFAAVFFMAGAVQLRYA